MFRESEDYEHFADFIRTKSRYVLDGWQQDFVNSIAETSNKRTTTLSWTSEASTNVSSFTMCLKTPCSFVVNSFFADSLIRKRTTRVILFGISSPLGEAHTRQMRISQIRSCKSPFRPPDRWSLAATGCLPSPGSLQIAGRGQFTRCRAA